MSSVPENPTAIFSISSEVTDKTDITDNDTFLEGVFGSCESDNQPIIVSFSGKPSSIDKRAWSGIDWKRGRSNYLLSEANNYFSLSSYTQNKNGFYSRKKEYFYALHAVMLDDIGTKVPMNRITLPPSWLIKTSDGNFQVGYILSVPLTDINRADRIMKSLISAGLCDPGAGGPTARLARLPSGMNGKYAPPFQCRTESWNPDRRYSVEDLMCGLNVIEAEEASKTQQETLGNIQSSFEQVYIPASKENTVLTALKRMNFYKLPLGGGKHDITCPFLNEHTAEIDAGTAYFEPNDQFPVGGFHCFHGHCQHRSIKNLLEALNIRPSSARMKPAITIVPGDIHLAVDAAEQELSRTSEHYQRSGKIVQVRVDPETKGASVFPLKLGAITAICARIIDWNKFDCRTQQVKRCDPPPKVIQILHEIEEFKYLPVLEGLARQPYFREDGTIAAKPGYDADTRIYGAFLAGEFTIKNDPTREDALQSLKTIESLLEEFSFKISNDKSAAICAILTAAVRTSLPTAPMFHVKAPQKGSGKSYLCEIIAGFATPQQASPSTFPHDDEECKKVLLSELRRSPAVVYFDNLKTDIIDYPSLCKALSAQYINERILGFSEIARVSTCSLFLSSGNNVDPIQDMTRRCITINLDTGCEVPATRVFKTPDLLKKFHNVRCEYVSAALTIVRAYILAGEPKQRCPNLSGFDKWSGYCRQSLLWLGQPDPAHAVFETMKSDPEHETLERLLLHWDSCFGNSPIMVRDIVENRNAELDAILLEVAPGKGEMHINKRSLGHYIKRNEGRIAGGLKFIRARIKRNAEVWQVVSVKSVVSLPEIDDRKVSEI